jgi:hypothetical protein
MAYTRSKRTVFRNRIDPLIQRRVEFRYDHLFSPKDSMLLV